MGVEGGREDVWEGESERQRGREDMDEWEYGKYGEREGG